MPGFFYSSQINLPNLVTKTDGKIQLPIVLAIIIHCNVFRFGFQHRYIMKTGSRPKKQTPTIANKRRLKLRHSMATNSIRINFFIPITNVGLQFAGNFINRRKIFAANIANPRKTAAQTPMLRCQWKNRKFHRIINIFHIDDFGNIAGNFIFERY